MNKIKFIALDIDGTLTNEKKEITSETKKALMKCQDHGIRLILASGRPTSAMTVFAKELDMHKHDGLYVSYNGSKVVNCQTHQVLFNEPLKIKEAKAVLEHLKNFAVYPMIDKDEYLYVNDVFADPINYEGNIIDIIRYEARGGHYLLCEQADLASFIDFEPNKILTAGQPAYLQDHYQEMMKPFEDQLCCMFTSPFYFEFTAKGIDKAKALQSVLTSCGCSSENIIAFGDGYNDASMIQYAGIGVAMGNAVKELKNVADFITASNQDDGIAKALYRYIPEVF